MRRAIWAAVAAVGLLAAGCGDDPREGYREPLREVFPVEDDAELDALADSICGLVEAGIDSGLDGMDAVDRAYAVFVEDGLDETDAFQVTLAAVAHNCPLDEEDLSDLP